MSRYLVLRCFFDMRHAIEAVIFEADGTILYTRELFAQAMEYVMQTHGYRMPTRRELSTMGGKPSEETYKRFAPHHRDHRELVDMHRIYQLEHLDLFDAYEGLHDLLSTLKSAGIKIGVCTNRAVNVLDLLDHVNIKDEFDAIMHADLMDNLKPHPEGILKLCKSMGVSARRTVMVGDTEADIGAGKAAGCALTIGLTHGVGTREMLEEAGADHIVGHLSDILPLVMPMQIAVAA